MSILRVTLCNYFVDHKFSNITNFVDVTTAMNGQNTYYRGKKQYELSNHLGNVLVTVSDRKRPVDTLFTYSRSAGTYKFEKGYYTNVSGCDSFNSNTTTAIADFYNADVITAQDYYPFGSPMSGRRFNSREYSRGFNGMEKDDEMEGNGNSYDFGARIYDARLGRWLRMDPLQRKFTFISPYSYVLNTPLSAIDPDGQDVVFLIAKDGAGGRGHMGAVIQDKKGNYYYMTMGAAEDANLSKVLVSGVQGGMVVKKLNAKNITEAIAEAKKDIDNAPYTDQIIFKTSSDMDDKIFKKAKKLESDVNSGKKEYKALTFNCADAVELVFEEGTGVKIDLGNNPNPNSKFSKLKENMKEVQKTINKIINPPSKKPVKSTSPPDKEERTSGKIDI